MRAVWFRYWRKRSGGIVFAEKEKDTNFQWSRWTRYIFCILLRKQVISFCLRSTRSDPSSNYFFLKVFHLRHFYCKVMDSVLKNISFTDCCAISMPKRWYINFIITHVRKVMSFDYSNFLRYTFSVLFRSSRPKVFLREGVLKICSKFAEERPCRSAISMKLLCNFIEIGLWHGCSSVNLLYIFRAPFLKNTSGRLLLTIFMI